MSLPLLAFIAVPLFLGPWSTHRLYTQVEENKKALVAVDNAGILTGRSGRAVLERWREMTARLAAAEAAHHAIHLCARTPGPQALACAAEDQVWENLWEMQLRFLEIETGITWRAIGEKGRAEGDRLGVALGLEGLSETLPVVRRQCPICLGRFRIEGREPGVARWETLKRKPKELVEVRWFREGLGEWEYRLRIPGERTDARELRNEEGLGSL